MILINIVNYRKGKVKMENIKSEECFCCPKCSYQLFYRRQTYNNLSLKHFHCYNCGCNIFDELIETANQVFIEMGDDKKVFIDDYGMKDYLKTYIVNYVDIS